MLPLIKLFVTAIDAVLAKMPPPVLARLPLRVLFVTDIDPCRA